MINFKKFIDVFLSICKNKYLKDWFRKEVCKNMNDDNFENRLIIAIGGLMVACLIGYNAFYIGKPFQVPPTDKKTYEIVKNYSSNESSKNSGDKNLVVNINTASHSELMKLNGVGESIASKIIDYRETRGGFSSIEEIMNVSGIGKKVFEKIKDNIRI